MLIINIGIEMRQVLFLIIVFCSQSIWAECYVEELAAEQNFINCMAVAEQGDADAQYIVANMYSSGQGADKDERKAVDWYRKSADQDNDLAQYGLGIMYEYGLGGLNKDANEAYEWYRRAADNGNYFAQNKLGLIMPKQETHEGHDMADNMDLEADPFNPHDEDTLFERFWDWLLGTEK